MRSTSTIQRGIEVVRNFDADGRTSSYGLRSIDGTVKQASIQILMSPLNAGESAPIHRRTVHFSGGSWSYITDSNGVFSSPNLGVVLVTDVSRDWSSGEIKENQGYFQYVEENDGWYTLKVSLIEPISNAVFVSEGFLGIGSSVVSGIDGYIGIDVRKGQPPEIQNAFGSDLSVSR
jgi:hypothetical protein